MVVTRPNVEKIAKEYQVSPKEVLDIYNSVFEFIRKHISKLPLETITEEEYNKTRTSFTIPGLGRLYTKYDRIQYLNEKFKQKENDNKENKTNVHVNSNDNGNVC